MEKENRLGTAPVKKLMLSVGLPSVFSMMLQAVYNIVDSAYLSGMEEAGEEALTALGLAFPIQLLMVAVAIGTGVGTNALLSRLLGEGDHEKANRTAGNAVFLGFVISMLFILFGFFAVPQYVHSQNKSGNISNVVILMAIDYLRICCGASFGLIFFSIYEKMLQATGRSLYSTIAQITGAIVNIVLDPVLIYGWLGCPKMGVKGAAWATVIGQIVSAAMAFLFHLKRNVEINNGFQYLYPHMRNIIEIYRIGLPAIVAQALLTVMTYGLNIILGRLPQVGEAAVTVYGLYCKVQQMIIFAAVGMRDAITPVVSYNYGRRSQKRVREGIRFGLIFTAFLMLLGLILIEAFAEPLSGFFSLSATTYKMCVECMRIVSLGFLFAGLSIAFQGVFQAIGCGVESLLISVGRQVLFILPVAQILSYFITGAENVSRIWWTFLIGEGITLLGTVGMYLHARKKKILLLEK